MNKLIFLGIALLSSGLGLAAEVDPALFGNFGHPYTGRPGTPVWSIRPAPSGARLFQHGDASSLAMQVMSAAQREGFWESMWWPVATAASAHCLVGRATVVCRVATAERRKIDDLNEAPSDFFHYDPVGGVISMLPLKK